MDSVELYSSDLAKLFEMELTIPEYQRIYCWREKNVIQLLEDLSEIKEPYHLGSIILHNDKKPDSKFAIVDGQQRLVTLSLLFQRLGRNNIKLLDKKFESKEAESYIAYNKHLIDDYIRKNTGKLHQDKLLENIKFSVLIINDGSIDLAYTFFSNQNSRGKSLTDYELLKAHHLRFINVEDQAKHLATRWDDVIQKNAGLARTFDIYLFRLRKWMRKKEWNENEKLKVKGEFEAMTIIPDIPPFGEQFHFYESIQGGTHFFAYADHFIYRYKTFSETKEFQSLHKLDGESHWWYRDVIEGLLFAYYLKFGSIYLSEALVCIEKIISQHRYNQSRSSLKYVLKHGSDSEIVMMIDQATSPTFFLAETLNNINRQTPIGDQNGIRKRYQDHIKSIHAEIKDRISIQSIKNLPL